MIPCLDAFEKQDGHMARRVDEFRFLVSDSIDLWQANVANPYIRAYNTAYKTYNQTFETQKSNDKERAELLVSAAAIMPGSFLIATAATGSLRVLAHRAMLKALPTNNLTRVLGGYNAATNNATSNSRSAACSMWPRGR